MPQVEPRTYNGPRLRNTLLMLICLAATLAIPVVGDPASPAINWSAAAVFGIGAALLGWLVIRPKSVALDATGFTIDGGFARQPQRVAWTEIDGFVASFQANGEQQIGFNYRKGARERSEAMKFTRMAMGTDAALPPLAGDATTLAAELNAYREKALAGA
jgi:hypothetical protein